MPEFYVERKAKHPTVKCGCGRRATILIDPRRQLFYCWCTKCQCEDTFAKTAEECARKYCERHGGKWGYESKEVLKK